MDEGRRRKLSRDYVMKTRLLIFSIVTFVLFTLLLMAMPYIFPKH